MERNDPAWERWDEVDRLFEAALDQPEPARERFLARECGGDLDLFRTLASLLEASAEADARLGGPGASLVRAAWKGPEGAGDASRGALRAGDVVGRYRVTKELGRGGMATVYEAERSDGAFRQTVAVKVLRHGPDTEEIVRRFLSERQILSGLSHPHIARLLDGGATGDGTPFLVMERVRGQPITAWADHGQLTVPQRLRLFLQVADAVRYAHQRLVVHRDLKPSNVLVDEGGSVKLLDFGIAKLLDSSAEPEDAALTRTGARPLTPQYASPEQVRGEAVTTASDIYQLGVLLYVLLTGRRPYAGRGTTLEEAITGGRTVRPSEATAQAAAGLEHPVGSGRAPPAPPPPGEPGGPTDSTPESVAAARGATPDGLRRALRGDLDTIILKALRTEPEERYGSVEALADDVRRHLEGRPIAARPASVPYRIRKFARRNPWSAPVAALLVVGLSSYVVTMALHSRQLERERNEARAHAERAEQIKGFLVGLFRTADPFATPDPERSRAITVVEALEVGAERARSELADRPDLRADLLASIAGVYEGLDLREPGLAHVREALALREELGQERTPEYAEDLGLLGTLLGLSGAVDSALAAKRRRLDLERDLFGPDHPRVAEGLLELSSGLVMQGNAHDALDVLAHREEALRILRAAGPGHEAQLGALLGLLADAYREVGRLDEAEAAAREGVVVHEERFGDAHPGTATQLVHLAQVLHARHRLDEAERVYRRALPTLERTLGPEHFITTSSWNNLGLVLGDARDFAGAEEVHRRILARRRAQLGTDRDPGVAGSLQNLGVALKEQGRWDEADSLAAIAHAIYQDVLPEGHHLVAFPLLTRAEIQLARGDAPAAERAAAEAAAILGKALPRGHYVTAAARCRTGVALVRQSRFADAEPLMDAAFRDLEAAEQTPPHLLRECAVGLAALYRATGRGDQASLLERMAVRRGRAGD